MSSPRVDSETRASVGWRSVVVLAFAGLAGLAAVVVPRWNDSHSRSTLGPTGSAGENFVMGVEQRAAIDRQMESKPEVVVVGNSMLGSRIDRRLLLELSGERRAVMFSKGSTFTPIWYLWLKQALERSHPPTTVVILFRDWFLTWPEFRFNQNSEAFAAGMMGGVDDPLVTRYFASMSGDGLIGATERIVELCSEPNGAVTRRLEDLALDLTRLESARGERRRSMNARFSMVNLRHDLPDDLGVEVLGANRVEISGYSKTTSFASALEDSLLPELVRLTEGRGVDLIVYRVKRRPAGDAGLRPASAQLQRYLRELRAWLEERDVVFLDGNSSIEFTLEDYADGDHISQESRPAFTRWFWEELQPHLAE